MNTSGIRLYEDIVIQFGLLPVTDCVGAVLEAPEEADFISCSPTNALE